MGRGGARIRVILAEDHPLYREGVVRAIRERPDLELVGECADGRVALAQIQELEPDVALLDMRLPSLSGLEVITALTDAEAKTKTIVLSAFDDGPLVYDAIAAGASGYLVKDADRQTICNAITAVARGKSVFSTELHDGLAEQIRSHRHDDRPRLSPREQQILSLTAEGRSTPEIARLLFLSTSTVKTHLQNIYEKLEVSDRAAAVAKALREGVLQ
jgi:two-component system, NarL family, nitrate/nitrite response regulator NarL